jgi:hypothetical protein
MTVIDDLDATKERWFVMDGGGRIQLKTISADAFKSIQKQTTKHKVDFKKVEGTPARLEYDEVNTELQNELFWDTVIVAWEDFFDRDEKPIVCNKENKILLMTKSAKFVKFVTDSLKVLSEDETLQAEQTEKNS